MAELIIKRGDTLPIIEATLYDQEGEVLDLSGATVMLYVVSTDELTTLVSAACTIVDAPNGVVRYVWQAGDTDILGKYDFEFEVTFSGGGIATVPNDGYNSLRIIKDLG